MRWTITDHAVDRYRERIAPDVDWAEARRRLAAATSRAVRQQQLTADGALLYRADDCLMVCTVDRRRAGLVVKTCYAHGDRPTHGRPAWAPSARTARDEAIDLVGELAVLALEAEGFRLEHERAGEPITTSADGQLQRVQVDAVTLARLDDRRWELRAPGLRAEIRTRARKGAVDAFLIGGEG